MTLLLSNLVTSNLSNLLVCNLKKSQNGPKVETISFCSVWLPYSVRVALQLFPLCNGDHTLFNQHSTSREVTFQLFYASGIIIIIIFLKKGREAPQTVPPISIELMKSMPTRSIIAGVHRSRGIRRLGARIMASPDGVASLKTTSFLWIQIAYNVTKIRLQSPSRLKKPLDREIQKASSDVSERRTTAANRHASWANGH